MPWSAAEPKNSAAEPAGRGSRDLIEVKAGRADPAMPWFMDRNRQNTSARSEMQSIGRTLDDLAHGGEAGAQRGQTVTPWLWLPIGLLIVVGFLGWLFLGPAPSSLATPQQSAMYGAPAPPPPGQSAP